ncbi:hypothetical protein L798_12533 [Zootermopsis nevadensis]|uniref:Uncharacterized protein n=1 Tax=Zootermopsis nevadensis TaxID=136037 RepID=A0A067QUJ9_ZOONE|nr:hypothetical protein L798_12533 [Zootermopsis nevadensis]
MAVPSLLYDAECWTLTKLQKQRIEVAEMKFVRSIAGYKRTSHIRNEDIRRKLGTFNLLDTICEHQRNCLMHIERMEANRIPQKMYKYKPKGKRGKGRPQKRWNDEF